MKSRCAPSALSPARISTLSTHTLPNRLGRRGTIGSGGTSKQQLLVSVASSRSARLRSPKRRTDTQFVLISGSLVGVGSDGDGERSRNGTDYYSYCRRATAFAQSIIIEKAMFTLHSYSRAMRSRNAFLFYLHPPCVPGHSVAYGRRSGAMVPNEDPHGHIKEVSVSAVDANECTMAPPQPVDILARRTSIEWP